MAKKNNTYIKNIPAFETKVSLLKNFVFDDPYLQEKIDEYKRDSLVNQPVVFLSVSDTNSRAKVFSGIGDDLSEAWNNAAKKTRGFITKENYKAVWLKADVISECDVVFYEDFRNNIISKREFFFKKGVSFDIGFKTALLSEQINCSGLYNPKLKVLSIKKLRKFYSDLQIDSFNNIPEKVLEFSCMGYICDNNKELHKLYPDEENYGRRIIHDMTRETVYDLINTSSDFLAGLVQEDGKFVYGINPVNNNYFKTYNILRHAGTIWSLIMQYDTTKNESLIPKIDSTIGYLMDNIESRDEDTSFLVERKADEIKVGGNAVAIITLSTYMDVFKSEKYKEIIRKLANGILECQEEDGSYFHVLSFPDFLRKDKYRIVYYDGEATFALARAYSVTKEEKFLSHAESAIDFFIKNNYEKYRDHWIAYAVNEVTIYNPLEKYLNFGLKNVNVNLDRIYKQDTTYHTYMELLMAAFSLFQRIKENNINISYMERFDLPKFISTIFRRAHHMLNGYLYPEIAMYMECPKNVVNTFCVRHDSFRIRIDDVQHFIGGYYHFYKEFDNLTGYLNLYVK